MSFDLSSLAGMAVANNNTRAAGATPAYLLTIEEAREACVVKDGNKIAKEDGSQALTIKLGRRALSLAAIKKGATRLNVPADSVDAVIEQLTEAVNAGAFDEAIVEAQTLMDPANKPVTAEAPVVTDGDLEPAEGVDLDVLDDEEEL